MVRANIIKGEEIILENIEVSLTVTGGSHEARGWRGSFRLPKGQHIDADDEGFRLELADGRVGQMLVSRINGDYVEFQGTGPLSKPEPST